MLNLQGAPKSKPRTDLSVNRADKASFSSKLNVEQATEVNANRHLLVLNILSIKYSTYDVKSDVNYCVYCDDRRIRVSHSATENHRIFNTTLCLKKVPSFILSVTLSNLNGCSHFVHCWKAYEICHKTHTTIPTSPYACCYTT